MGLSKYASATNRHVPRASEVSASASRRRSRAGLPRVEATGTSAHKDVSRSSNIRCVTHVNCCTSSMSRTIWISRSPSWLPRPSNPGDVIFQKQKGPQRDRGPSSQSCMGDAKIFKSEQTLPRQWIYDLTDQNLWRRPKHHRGSCGRRGRTTGT